MQSDDGVISGIMIILKQKGGGAMVSEAQKRATTKYEHNNYDKITVRLPKGERERWTAAATAAGQSLNAFIVQVVQDRMQDDGIIE